MAILSGIHTVAEALRAKHPLERLLVVEGAGGPRVQEIIDLARRASLPVVSTARGARPPGRHLGGPRRLAMGAGGTQAGA